jgi:hypothetical protein
MCEHPLRVGLREGLREGLRVGLREGLRVGLREGLRVGHGVAFQDRPFQHKLVAVRVINNQLCKAFWKI